VVITSGGGEVGGEGFVIQHNRDEDGEVIEEDFSDYPVLFRIDRSVRADVFREALQEIAGLKFLRRESL
jgi:hypothetical protein